MTASAEAIIAKISVGKWIKLLNKSHIARQQHGMGGGRERKISGSLGLTGAKRRVKTKERNKMRGESKA